MGKITVCLFFFFFSRNIKYRMLSMSRDGTIDRSMETKSEEILSAGTNGPVSHLSATDTCPLPPLPLQPPPLERSSIKRRVGHTRPRATSAISKPRGRSTAPRNPRPQTSTPAVRCTFRYTRGCNRAEKRGGDSIFSIVGLSRQISISTRFCGLLGSHAILKRGCSLFFFPLFSENFSISEAKLERDSRRSEERVGRNRWEPRYLSADRTIFWNRSFWLG